MLKKEDFTNFKIHSRQKALEILLEFSNRLDFADTKAQFLYEQTMLRVIGKNTLAFKRTVSSDDIILTRVRKNCSSGTLFVNTENVWLPPEEVTRLGRANFPKAPVFYCSDWPATSIFEVKPNQGDWLTITNYKVNIPQFDCIVLGESPDSLTGFNDLPPFLQGIHDYFRKIFTERINEANINNYFKTAIVCKGFITESTSIMYPSVASNLNGWNFVFSEKFANKNIKFSDSRTQRVFNYIDQMDFKVKCLFESNEITKDNDLIWEKIFNCKGHELAESIYTDR
ncbi:MAG: hypothetical protein IPO48_15205 [Saprospiraceae bacterium]|nr:hypothetical protein [Saprospiraceae bacterium]